MGVGGLRFTLISMALQKFTNENEFGLMYCEFLTLRTSVTINTGVIVKVLLCGSHKHINRTAVNVRFHQLQKIMEAMMKKRL